MLIGLLGLFGFLAFLIALWLLISPWFLARIPVPEAG